MKDIENQEGETRASAIRQLQNTMEKVAGLQEKTANALRLIADKILGGVKDEYSNRLNKTLQDTDNTKESKEDNSLNQEIIDNVDKDHMGMDESYSMLGLHPLTKESVRVLYKHYMRKYHPDTGGNKADTEKLQRLKVARKTIKDIAGV